MLFNSLQFLWFFPCAAVLHFLMPQRFRWMLLLLASYYFYMCWVPAYLILIVLSTLIDYAAGIRIGKSSNPSERRMYLALSLVANLGLLFTFKYFNFFNDSVRALFEQSGIAYGIPALDILLPVGISFYTFQTMSYTIDVYREKIKPETHFGIFALYVAFFPQLVAGPIERAVHLLPQFRARYQWDIERVAGGLKLMLWGFFKKIVIADRLATLVDAAYNHPEAQSGFILLIATYLFAFQIYCDFSGYSDIACGSARVLGYDLMENFRFPYAAKSISEFWKRWHISLSTWFRDYFYISIGGNRVRRLRWYLNLLAVFLVSGIWHGANWTFLAWGGLHGSCLVGALILQEFPAVRRASEWASRWPRCGSFANVFVTFHLVILAWVFFRANHISDAFSIIQRILTPDWMAHAGRSVVELKIFLAETEGASAFKFVVNVFFIGMLLAVDTHLHTGWNFMSGRIWMRLRPALYAVLVILIALFGVFTDGKQFIYFQF